MIEIFGKDIKIVLLKERFWIKIVLLKERFLVKSVLLKERFFIVLPLSSLLPDVGLGYKEKDCVGSSLTETKANSLI